MTTQTSAITPGARWAPLRSRPLMMGVMLLTVLGFVAIGQGHDPAQGYGWLSLLPTLLVLVFALVTQRTVEALFSGAVAGLLMLAPGELVGNVVDLSMTVMMDETIAWLILVCGLMGGLITILEKGGSVLSFSNAMVKRIRSKRQSMLVTFLLGLMVFIDDYLNAIAISSSMKKITDTYKVSREKLAYLVDSTAAPICILVPISTWAVFFGGLLEANEVAESGAGLKVYIEAIPYMMYGWVTLAVVLLVALGKVPDLGAMKAAEQRAAKGQPKPDGVEEISLGQDGPSNDSSWGVLNFALPMVVLVAASWYYDIDLLAGVFVALVFTMVLYGVQNLLSMHAMFDAVYDGIKIMLLPIATVVGGFMLKNVNDQLGLTQYVIETVAPLLTPGMFPAIIFLVMTALVFGTASSWGLFAVAMPIVFPLAAEVGSPLPLVIGALISASAAGSHSCFFSDSTVLSAQGSGCTAMQHALSQIPYALIGIVLTTGFFLVIA
ncbi:Na+/H+ antiporter NhaC family protein [Ferrimonas marina]|uniref:Na+/H+ antiporter NhaC n=1 Tax=Ferrimonas marina TaxID=299255 RepID=A0A1M5YRT0_9GAMM|nr:Na+/H+ antiporter NhaC family protein [Ferrimonas marina]SHI14681.1 Na+/H+ antiporter NhaC [Ferrimonas marina]